MPPLTAAARARDPLEAGLAHHRAGDLARAEACYRRALGKRPGDPAALRLLGLAALDRGRPERALQLFDKALRRAPDDPEALHAAGAALQALGRWPEAAARYRAALAADPDRALTHSNLGNALRRTGDVEEARRHLARAVEIDPGFAEGWSNLGLAEKARGETAAAVAAHERAVALRPRAAECHYNLGNAYAAAGRPEEAVAAFGRALELAPGHVGAHVNLAHALKAGGDLGAARAHQEAAVALAPGDAEAHWNLGLTLLMAEEWRRGWAEFDWRLAFPDYGMPAPEGPRWDGGPLDGGTLLVNHEQGFGDAIQFMRFAADAAGRGARVVYRGPASLRPLIGGLDGVAETAALDEAPPPFDAWVPMMSLPRALGLDHGAALGRAPYLAADPARVARWRARLPAADGPRIGIAWQGNPGYRADAERSIPLGHFRALARLPGVRLVSLQKGAGTEQIADWPAGLPLDDLGPALDADGAFLDTAAVATVLDLVVTSDTALAHLAGALGKEAHVALGAVPDWRWGLERADTVWYPSLTLHRQRRPGDWAGVFRKIAEALAPRVHAHG